MAVTSARSIVDVKEKGHFQREDARVDKYTLADELPKQLSELGLRPRTMSTPSYTLCRMSLDHKEHMLQFLRVFFFRDEPMNKAVNLLETLKSRCQELEDYASSTLNDLVSVAARDENGDFVGICVNGIARRADAEYKDKTESCENPKFRRILKVLGHLEREAKIWEKLPKECHTVLEIRIASTHSEWRGRGLMRVLCEESERIARYIGAGALRMDATSAFSAAVAKKLGYKKVYKTLYSEVPYAPQPEPPHTEASVHIKVLD